MEKSGLIFFKTVDIEKIRVFYEGEIGCQIWMDQGDCLIYNFGGFMFGFCEREEADTNGIITFFFEDKEDVDRYYKVFAGKADGEPRDNPKYPIYHFFTKDPEGRMVEFQHFYNVDF